jgi:hypothetical protein
MLRSSHWVYFLYTSQNNTVRDIFLSVYALCVCACMSKVEERRGCDIVIIEFDIQSSVPLVNECCLVITSSLSVVNLLIILRTSFCEFVILFHYSHPPTLCFYHLSLVSITIDKSASSNHRCSGKKVVLKVVREERKRTL